MSGRERRLDTKVALTVLVPADEEVQKLRREYDSAYKRWPPHFNIDCFPFFGPEEHEALAPVIQGVCKKFGVLDVSLGRVNHFPAGKKKTGTLYAEVDDKTGQLCDLRRELLRAVGLQDKPQKFHPHVTLGRFDNQNQLEAVEERVQKEWKARTCQLKGLHLIVRGDATPFVSEYFFPFGEDHFCKVHEPYITQECARKEGTQASGETAELDSQFDVKVSQLADYFVYRLKKKGENLENGKNGTKKAAIRNILVIDNSGSMGRLTAAATKSIGRGMFSEKLLQAVDMTPGTVIAFDTDARVLSRNVKTAADVDCLVFPGQGSTNITAAMKAAVQDLLEAEEEQTKRGKKIHHIVTFLSDGGHNSGPSITSNDIMTWRRAVDKREAAVSFVVVGIGNPDTSLGMKVKTGLETVSMAALESVYYAKNSAEMEQVLSQVTEGCVKSLGTGRTVQLRVEGGVFLENRQNEVKVFVEEAGECVVTVRRDTGREHAPQLVIGPSLAVVTEVQAEPADVNLMVESVAPKLSQMKIAHGTSVIRPLIEALEELVDECEEVLFTATAEQQNQKEEVKRKEVGDIGKTKMNGFQRLQVLQKRQVRTRQTKFQEARNKLKLLLASVSNDSAQQAEYLTGIKKKYGAKAVLRAGTDETTVEDVLKDVQGLREDLEKALKKDAARRSDDNEDEPESILSLNTAGEQFKEWIDTLGHSGKDDALVLDDIYSALVCFGFPGYPVGFEHNNAVQMDPFQTRCTWIEPCPIDTGSLMLAQRLRHEVTTHSRTKMSDALVLISPAAPEAGLVGRRSAVYRFLCSVTLCRDLYMYNPKMTFSMHAHGLVRAVEGYADTGSTAYLDLALRIVYSIRKFWGRRRCESVDDDNMKLFQRWWKEWGTLTSSEADGCNHPVQLLLMLAAFDLPALGLRTEWEDAVIPLVNLINEGLARDMKKRLRYIISQNTRNTKNNNPAEEDDTKLLAVRLMQQLLGITADNSPKPHPDPMVSEPTVGSVRESCQHWADVEDPTVFQKFEAADFEGYVENQGRGYTQAFLFGLVLQGYLTKEKKTWEEDVIPMMEDTRGVPAELLTHVEGEMRGLRNLTVLQCFEAGMEEREKKNEGKEEKQSNKRQQEVVAANMFLQAVLCHDSHSRREVTESSVFDATTMQDIVKDLRMAFYFEACQVKRQEWLAMVGDVSYARALEADLTVFEQMIGVHTHGLCKSVFWAMLRAAKANDEKLRAFLSKSNNSVSVCLRKVK